MTMLPVMSVALVFIAQHLDLLYDSVTSYVSSTSIYHPISLFHMLLSQELKIQILMIVLLQS